jgi:hypothetical protein
MNLDSKQVETTNAQTQRLAALGFMLAGVCHEVSNPLAAVHSMLQILQSRRAITPEMMEKGLASMSANIARALEITRKLGDFSRVGAEPPMALSVDAAMEEAISLLRMSACGAGVRVDYRGAPEARVLARPGNVQQILSNICSMRRRRWRARARSRRARSPPRMARSSFRSATAVPESPRTASPTSSSPSSPPSPRAKHRPGAGDQLRDRAGARRRDPCVQPPRGRRMLRARAAAGDEP